MTKINKPAVVIVVIGLVVLITATFPVLIQNIKLGLEFQGGYEIVYQATAKLPGQVVNHEVLVQTANMLAKRADQQSVAEPAVNIFGNDQIRVELAGITAGDPIISELPNIPGLPVMLKQQYSETVGGVLGANDLQDTIKAGAIAVIAIFLFLLVIYRSKALIAIFATIVSLWLLLTAFVVLHATLSLSAIVAFVLAIGIASDANIIAFERAREEFQYHHLSAGEALIIGGRKAWYTIADANAAVLICVTILLLVGIGPIRGFAVTSMLSIAASFIANVFLAHWLVARWFGHNQKAYLFNKVKFKNVSAPVFNFIKASNWAIILSVLFIGIGMIYGLTQPLNLDIEFKAGTALDLKLNQPITQETAATLISQAGIPPATVTIGEPGQSVIAARFDDVLSVNQVNRIVDLFRHNYGKGVSFAENIADPGVAKDLVRKSVTVIVLALLGAAAFIYWRFNWRMAIATMISVISAVIFTLSCFALFHLEIDITYIAAMLIIIETSNLDTY